jgi:hypothetical protein
VVGCDAIHVDGLLGDPAEKIPATDDDRDLTATLGKFDDLFCDTAYKNGIDPESASRGQGFA